MQWSRELRTVRHGATTALRAVSAMARDRLSPEAAAPDVGSISRIEGFGSNPGRLAMFVHTPPQLAERPPLVVLLHGCGQSAHALARDGGWLELADRCGFPLVLPEQSEENNRSRCFQWFRPAQVGRGLGEAASIRQMVEAAEARFATDPRRIYIAGLSAGGATTAALLAAYPDVFAAGAVVAGLPVGAATGTAQALARMADAGASAPAAMAERVRRAAPVGYAGPWPRLIVWHGLNDRVVDPANGRLLASQWATLQALGAALPVEAGRSARCESWGDAAAPAVQLWTLLDEGHVWPANATAVISRFWGLAP
jgi:poly(hydroxyalkanoate) depolymerase family esterase